MPVVQFTPFSSTVSPAFWHALIKVKLEVQKLSADALPIVASYSAGRSIKDRETGADIPLNSNLSVLEDAFHPREQTQAPPGSTIALGQFKNFNTIEEFKEADKQALFNSLAEEVDAISPVLSLLSTLM
jgi:ubiquitin-like modifier-activating enzyme ATG7